MSFTATTTTVQNATGVSTPLISFTDGTNYSFTHVSLNTSGAAVNPATSDLQTTGNASLAAIQSSVAAPALPSGGSTSALQTSGNASLSAIQTAVTTPSLPAGSATATLQTTGNTALSAIQAAVTTPALPSGAASSALQTAGNSSLSAIAASVAAPSSPPPQIVVGSTVTRPANTTAYSAYQLVANSTTAGSVTPGTIAAARGVNTPSTILRCRLQKTGTSITNANFRLHLYNSAPTVTNGDGNTWLSTSSGYIGSLDVTVDKAFSDLSEGIGVPTMGATMAFTPASGTQNVYYLIEARGAYTPISGEVFTPILEIQ